MPWRGLYKEPRILVAAFLFAFWFLFNQGKMTALGIFGGKVGYMFTEPGWANILGGLIVHGVVLLACMAFGFPLAVCMGWILRKIKA